MRILDDGEVCWWRWGFHDHVWFAMYGKALVTSLFRFTPDWCGVTDGVMLVGGWVMWSGDLVVVSRGFTGDWLVVDWSTQCLVGHLVVYRRKARYILCDSNAVPEGMG